MGQKWRPIDKDAAYRALIAAVILQAIEDSKDYSSRRNAERAREALAWLRRDGIFWAQIIGIGIYKRDWLQENLVSHNTY